MVHWAARPHMFTFAFFAYWVIALADYEQGRRRTLYALPLLTVVWANTHGAFIVGFVLVGMYLAAALFDRRFLRARHLFLVLLASIAASLANPNGFKLITNSFGYIGDDFLLRFTTEYNSPEFPPEGFLAVPGHSACRDPPIASQSQLCPDSLRGVGRLRSIFVPQRSALCSGRHPASRRAIPLAAASPSRVFPGPASVADRQGRSLGFVHHQQMELVRWAGRGLQRVRLPEDPPRPGRKPPLTTQQRVTRARTGPWSNPIREPQDL